MKVRNQGYKDHRYAELGDWEGKGESQKCVDTQHKKIMTANSCTKKPRKQIQKLQQDRALLEEKIGLPKYTYRPQIARDGRRRRKQAFGGNDRDGATTGKEPQGQMVAAERVRVYATLPGI